ncbi:Lysine-specific demethylase 3B [Homalodisca vitripennis]|nr:Lysine-specific demethylase 3B [Homalodisca vitripennis]
MLTQIVPADCLETLGLKLQQFQDTYSIPLSTTANYEKEGIRSSCDVNKANSHSSTVVKSLNSASICNLQSAITMPSSVKITKEVVKQQENIETLEQVRRSSKNNQVIHVRTNQQHYFSEPEQGKEGLDVFKGFDDQINEEQGQLKQVLSYPHCNQILDDNSKLLKESFEIENMEKMKLLLNGVQYPNNNHNINEITLSHMVGDFDIEKIEVDLLQKSIKTYEWDMLMGNIPSKIIKGNILQKFDNYSDKTCTEKKSIFSNLISEGCKNNNFLRNKIIQQPVMGYSADKVIYGDRLMTESSLKNCKIDQSMPEGMTLKTYVEQFSDIGNHKEDIINYKVGYQILDERIVPDLPRYPQNNIIQADLHLQAEGNPYGSIEKQLVKCVGNGQSSLQLPEEDSNNQQIVNKTSILTAGFPKNSLMILQKDVEHSDNNQLIIFKSISSVIEEKNDKANSKKQPDNNLSALIKDSWTFLQVREIREVREKSGERKQDWKSGKSQGIRSQVREKSGNFDVGLLSTDTNKSKVLFPDVREELQICKSVLDHPPDACPLTPTKSKELFPDVPHSWLCGGRLLHLHKSNHPGNFKLFQDQWRRGQPVLVSDVTKHLDQDLWHPESFARDFGDIRNVLVDCMTGRSVHSHLMREFWEGFKHPERRLKDEDGNPMLLKLKDWPPGDDFAEMLPSRENCTWAREMPSISSTHALTQHNCRLTFLQSLLQQSTL